MKRVITSLIMIIMLITFVISFSSYSEVSAYDYAGKISTIDGKTDATNANTATTKVVAAILNIARIIAVGIALIMLTVIAMKYMYAAPGEKAEIKKHAVVYIVGAIVLFATSGLLSIIKSFAEGNIGTGS